MTDADLPRLRDRPWLLGAVWWLALCASAYEIIPAGVAPVIMSDLAVDATAVSWLISIMFLGSVVMSIPSGIVLDRISLRIALVTAGALLCLGGIGSWYFTHIGAYWPLLGSRAVASVGFVLLWNAALETYGRFANRATATSVFIASSPIGFAMGHVTGPMLATEFGLPVVFLVYPLLIVPAMAVLLVVRDAPGSTGGEGEPSLPSLDDFASLLRNRAMVTVCALGFIAYSLYLFVNSWMPSYLNTELGFSIAESGLLIAVFPLVGAVSRAAGGVTADRLFGGRRRPVVLTAFVVTSLLVALLYVSRTFLVVSAALLGSGFFVQLSLGLFYSYVPDLLPAERVSTGIALLTSISLLGAFSAPIIAASLIEYIGPYITAFGYAFALAALGTVLAWGFAEPADYA